MISRLFYMLCLLYSQTELGNLHAFSVYLYSYLYLFDISRLETFLFMVCFFLRFIQISIKLLYIWENRNMHIYRKELKKIEI